MSRIAASSTGASSAEFSFSVASLARFCSSQSSSGDSSIRSTTALPHASRLAKAAGKQRPSRALGRDTAEDGSALRRRVRRGPEGLALSTVQ
eukprot:11493533-Alexandrium_andersonii.AAC.1